MLITEYLNILDISADNEKEGLYTFIMDDMKTFARRRHNVFFSLSLLIPAVLFFSCKNNVNTMFQDYNSRFTYVEDEIPDPVPGDEKFEPSKMLRLRYDIYDNETLNLYAPNNCNSYKWTIYNPFIKEEIDENGVTKKYPNGKPVEIQFSNSTLNSVSQRFVLVPSKSGLDLGVYILELTVTDKDNNIYTDICKLNINQHID